MSYDIHITRAEFWAENRNAKIRLEEWINVAKGDARLEHRGDNVFAAVGFGSTGEDVPILWYAGDVYSENPNQAVVRLMEDLAQRLGARVQGDDGEIYASR